MACGLSLAAAIAVGFLLLVSLLLTAAVAALGKMFASAVPEGLLQPLGSLVSFLVVAALFALMFKWLPDTHVAWRDVWLGAVVTALLFEVGKVAMATAMSRHDRAIVAVIAICPAFFRHRSIPTSVRRNKP